MIKNISLFNYKVSHLNKLLFKLDTLEKIFIKKLNVDTSIINIPITIKLIIIDTLYINNNLATSEEVKKFINNLKMPFGSNLIIQTRLQEDYLFNETCLLYYMDNTITTHFTTTNNFKLHWISNKFSNICNAFFNDTKIF